MPTVEHLLPTKLENPARIPDRVYIPAMAMRTRAAIQQVRGKDKDAADHDWEVRQILLQVFRQHGFLVVLRPGDISYHDDDMADEPQELIANFNDGAL